MKTNIALVSVNPTVGALVANADRLYAAYVAAADQGADIVLTPEMSLTGYPLQDLTQRPSFLADVALMRTRLMEAVKASGRTAAIVFGHPTDTARHDGNRRQVHNSATFYDPATDEAQVVHKVELPNYGVFDELRNYVEGPQPRVVEWRGVRLGLLICEDGWFPRVTHTLAAQGADVLLWINGSPFSSGKNVKRRAHAANRVREARVPVAYVNLVGGQDELVFDGDCFSWDGCSYVETALFRETVQMVTFDIERGRSTRAGEPIGPLPDVRPTGLAEIYAATVEGMRGYLGKSRFDKAMEGYSGGVDSGLVAALGADAFGPENMLLVRLPSKYSSEGSLTDAADGARALGCPMRTIAIEPVVEALRAAYASQQIDAGPAPARHVDAQDRERAAATQMSMMTDEYREAFLCGEKDDDPRFDRWKAGLAPKLTGVADENIQARARGTILMAISNQEGYMVLTTGNRSEALTGFMTVSGGDTAGGLAPLKDMPKTMVWALCRYRNSLTKAEIERLGYLGPEAVVVPEEIISKPPSAELRADQQDSDSLPDYGVLDPLLHAIVDDELGVDDVVEAGIADRRVALDIEGKVFVAEYKRRLGAPGIKLSDHLLNNDRRYPIVNGYRSWMRDAITAWDPKDRV